VGDPPTKKDRDKSTQLELLRLNGVQVMVMVQVFTAHSQKDPVKQKKEKRLRRK